MDRPTKLHLSLFVSAALCGVASSVHAQDVPTGDVTGATVSTQGGLEEVVVTATKRETNLQDTPIAMSVMSIEALDDRHVQSLLDLADGSVPSLRIATFEAR